MSNRNFYPYRRDNAERRQQQRAINQRNEEAEDDNSRAENPLPANSNQENLLRRGHHLENMNQRVLPTAQNLYQFFATLFKFNHFFTQVDSAASLQRIGQLFGARGEIFAIEWSRLNSQQEMSDLRDTMRFRAASRQLRAYHEQIQNAGRHAQLLAQIVYTQNVLNEQLDQSEASRRRVMNGHSTAIQLLLGQYDTRMNMAPELVDSLFRAIRRDHEQRQRRIAWREAREQHNTLLITLLRYYRIEDLYRTRQRLPMDIGRMERREVRDTQSIYQNFVSSEAGLRRLEDMFQRLNIRREFSEVLDTYFQRNRDLREQLHDIYLGIYDPETSAANIPLVNSIIQRYRPVVANLRRWAESTVELAENGQVNLLPLPDTIVPVDEPVE